MRRLLLGELPFFTQTSGLLGFWPDLILGAQMEKCSLEFFTKNEKFENRKWKCSRTVTFSAGKKYVGWDLAETRRNEASNIYLAVGENPNRFEVRKLSNDHLEVVGVLENPSIAAFRSHYKGIPY